MNTHFLRQLRALELEIAIPWMEPKGTVLEIGAGAGWQAKILAERGFGIEAVDVAESEYREVRIWPVKEYDGRHLPFEDHKFDLVLTSNVLEHIPCAEDFQREVLRVLKPGGRALHVLPSASWRAWTMVAHFPRLTMRRIEKIWEILRRSPSVPRGQVSIRVGAKILRILFGTVPLLFPPRHGARGNALTELFYFSRFFWIPFFEKCGWQLDRCQPNRLFYTGHQLLEARLSLECRRRMSRLFGSACLLYMLRARDEQNSSDPEA